MATTTTTTINVSRKNQFAEISPTRRLADKTFHWQLDGWMHLSTLLRSCHLVSETSNTNHPRMRATTYAWSLLVTWQRWRSHIWIRHGQKLHGTRKPHGSMFYTEAKLWPIEVLNCGSTYFWPFCSCNLDLDPMTFIRTWPVFPGDIPDVWK